MIQIIGTDLFVLNMRTRMPFRYGIATMTEVPHLFVRVRASIDGKTHSGIAADHLPPKWFTKNPDTTFEADIAEMQRVIRSACEVACGCGSAASVFALWRKVYSGQQERFGTTLPPLLWAFGVTLIERAMIDASCRARGISFATVVRGGELGINLAEIHPQLAGLSPAELLPATPLRSIIFRHTVGLGDPLTDAEIPAAERVDDGLPQALQSCVRAYGLTHFKIKLFGDVRKDLARLRGIYSVLSATQNDFAFTLDGNENFKDVAPFIELWRKINEDAELRGFLGGLIFVEQPIHRDVALSDGVKAAMLKWSDRPPMIIDESDGALDSVRRALECGYRGTSHKNCKGVFKGIASACLLESLRRKNPGQTFILSGEDLSNVAPVALLQDLAVVATLGIGHVERNGHHYFAGLSALPRELQQEMLARHGDLFHCSPRGFPSVRIETGAASVQSVVDAPFGYQLTLDPERLAVPLTPGA